METIKKILEIRNGVRVLYCAFVVLLTGALGSVVHLNALEIKQEIDLPKADKALFTAVQNDDIDAARQALSDGADVNVVDGWKRTPLFRVKSVGMAQWLLANGANIDALDMQGETPLFSAQTGETANFFIDKGMYDTVKKNMFGHTPLHTVKNAQAVRLLIREGADVNARDDQKMTPLFYAANKEIARLLLDNGALLEEKDDQGHTPLRFACMIYAASGATEENNPTVEQPGEAALFDGIKGAIEELLDRGADMEVRGENDKTILANMLGDGQVRYEELWEGFNEHHPAVVAREKALISLLIRSGAKVPAEAELQKMVPEMRLVVKEALEERDNLRKWMESTEGKEFLQQLLPVAGAGSLGGIIEEYMITPAEMRAAMRPAEPLEAGPAEGEEEEKKEGEEKVMLGRVQRSAQRRQRDVREVVRPWRPQLSTAEQRAATRDLREIQRDERARAWRPRGSIVEQEAAMRDLQQIQREEGARARLVRHSSPVSGEAVKRRGKSDDGR